MRVLLICVGSRGDHEPFIALAKRLCSNGDHVDFFLQQDYEHLLPDSDNLTRHVLPFGSSDFYQFVASPSHGATSEDPVERFIGVVCFFLFPVSSCLSFARQSVAVPVPEQVLFLLIETIACTASICTDI